MAVIRAALLLGLSALAALGIAVAKAAPFPQDRVGEIHLQRACFGSAYYVLWLEEELGAKVVGYGLQATRGASEEELEAAPLILLLVNEEDGSFFVLMAAAEGAPVCHLTGGGGWNWEDGGGPPWR